VAKAAATWKASGPWRLAVGETGPLPPLVPPLPVDPAVPLVVVPEPVEAGVPPHAQKMQRHSAFHRIRDSVASRTRPEIATAKRGRPIFRRCDRTHRETGNPNQPLGSPSSAEALVTVADGFMLATIADGAADGIDLIHLACP
jgi:hypothetical protein